jgi:hypothetical protein
MNKMFVRVTLCVLALSLVSLAADKTLVTTKPVKGGHVTKVETPSPDTVYFLNNFDNNTTGTYYCCSGNVVVGPENTEGESPFNEAIQFTLSSASHITGIATAVNYIVQGTSTQFELNIEADASGVPSGTPLNANPYKVTLDSQTFGQCCEIETRGILDGGLSLPAGTYWVVWGTSSSSDLFAEVNQAIHDQTTDVNVAYSETSGSTGSWTTYSTNLPFAVRVKGTTP